MTDLMPNDLSQLSDDEFSALCPHDGHAPGPEPLSPAAQAVMGAYYKGLEATSSDCATEEDALAAALRAAADQVVPGENVDEADYDCLHTKWAAQGKQETREAFLAIATELENQ